MKKTLARGLMGAAVLLALAGCNNAVLPKWYQDKESAQTEGATLLGAETDPDNPYSVKVVYDRPVTEADAAGLTVEGYTVVAVAPDPSDPNSLILTLDAPVTAGTTVSQGEKAVTAAQGTEPETASLSILAFYYAEDEALGLPAAMGVIFDSDDPPPEGTHTVAVTLPEVSPEGAAEERIRTGARVLLSDPEAAGAFAGDWEGQANGQAQGLWHAVYRVTSRDGSSVLDYQVTVTVAAIPPSLLSATADRDRPEVRLVFSEAVTAAGPEGFSLEGYRIINIAPDAGDDRALVLTLDAPVSGNALLTYDGGAGSVADLAGNPLADASLTVFNPFLSRLRPPPEVTLGEDGETAWAPSPDNAFVTEYQVQLFKDGAPVSATLSVPPEGPYGAALGEDMRKNGPGSYDARVTALGDGVSYAGSEAAASNLQTSRLRPVPLGLYWDGDKAAWANSDYGADNTVVIYKEELPGGLAWSVTRDGEASPADFTETIAGAGPGIYYFSVTAAGDGKLLYDSPPSGFSPRNIKPKKLSPAVLLTLDAAGSVTWEGGADAALASGYLVRLYKGDFSSGQAERRVGAEAPSGGGPFSAAFGPLQEGVSYWAVVTVLGDRRMYLDSDPAIAASGGGSVTPVKRATVPLMLWSGDTAKWADVPPADLPYKVELYKDEAMVASISEAPSGVTGADFSGAITAGGPGVYAFRVTPLGNGASWLDGDPSDYSEERQVLGLIPAPAPVAWKEAAAEPSAWAPGLALAVAVAGAAVTPLDSISQGGAENVTGTVLWTAVPGAAGYTARLYKDGEAVTPPEAFPPDTLSRDYLREMTASGAGKYTVKVWAASPGAPLYLPGESVEAVSPPRTITQAAAVLSAGWVVKRGESITALGFERPAPQANPGNGTGTEDTPEGEARYYAAWDGGPAPEGAGYTVTLIRSRQGEEAVSVVINAGAGTPPAGLLSDYEYTAAIDLTGYIGPCAFDGSKTYGNWGEFTFTVYANAGYCDIDSASAAGATAITFTPIDLLYAAWEDEEPEVLPFGRDNYAKATLCASCAVTGFTSITIPSGAALVIPVGMTLSAGNFALGTGTWIGLSSSGDGISVVISNGVLRFVTAGDTSSFGNGGPEASTVLTGSAATSGGVVTFTAKGGRVTLSQMATGEDAPEGHGLKITGPGSLYLGKDAGLSGDPVIENSKVVTGSDP